MSVGDGSARPSGTHTFCVACDEAVRSWKRHERSKGHPAALLPHENAVLRAECERLRAMVGVLEQLLAR